MQYFLVEIWFRVKSLNFKKVGTAFAFVPVLDDTSSTNNTVCSFMAEICRYCTIKYDLWRGVCRKKYIIFPRFSIGPLSPAAQFSFPLTQFGILKNGLTDTCAFYLTLN
jgi:hypothetical protein